MDFLSCRLFRKLNLQRMEVNQLGHSGNREKIKLNLNKDKWQQLPYQTASCAQFLQQDIRLWKAGFGNPNSGTSFPVQGLLFQLSLMLCISFTSKLLRKFECRKHILDYVLGMLQDSDRPDCGFLRTD